MAGPTRRFVVQRHAVREGEVHYDLMVEDGASLVTFQLEAPPPAEAPGPVVGRRSFDHRLRYLDYEGPISGGRGRVAIHDRGTAADEEGDPRSGRWVSRFAGELLRGRYELRDEPEEARRAGDPAGDHGGDPAGDSAAGDHGGGEGRGGEGRGGEGRGGEGRGGEGGPGRVSLAWVGP